MARRGWGEGSICPRIVTRRLADGTVREYTYWRALVPGGPFGRRREKLSRSERVARAWLKRNLERHDRGLPIGAERVTLGAYAVDWLKGTSLRVRPTTTDFYRAALRHIEPIADVPVAALSPAHVRALIQTETEAGRSSRTVRGIVQTLALVLRQAMEDGITDRNVAALVRLPKLESKPPRHFTAAEARRFLDAAEGDALVTLFTTAIGTGLRRGELLALTRRDVDLAAGVLSIKAAKSRAGVRRVPLAPAVRQALSEAMDTGNGMGHVGPIWPFRPEYVTRHFQALCREAGVPVIRFHDLRHTAATLMAEAGVSEETRKWLLGHTNVAMTRLYSHESERLMREAVEKLGEAIA